MFSRKKLVCNIFKVPSCKKGSECFEPLLRTPYLTLERIVSFGQRTPPGRWLRQARDEWVILLSGSATLVFWGRQMRAMKPGDYVFIPAGLRHRLERTHPKKPSVWLALHTKSRGAS